MDQSDTPPPPTLTKASLVLEWSAPQNPPFPVKQYYVTVQDQQGNKQNFPVAPPTTQYTYEIDITNGIPRWAFIGVTYPVGGPGVSTQKVTFNVEPNKNG